MRSSARTFESVSPRRRVTAKSVESPTTRRMYESLSPALAVTGDRVRKARRDDSRTGVRTRGDSRLEVTSVLVDVHTYKVFSLSFSSRQPS